MPGHKNKLVHKIVRLMIKPFIGNVILILYQRIFVAIDRRNFSLDVFPEVFRDSHGAAESMRTSNCFRAFLNVPLNSLSSGSI